MTGTQYTVVTSTRVTCKVWSRCS